MMISREYSVIVYAPINIDVHLTVEMGSWLDELIYQHRANDICSIVVDYDLLRDKNSSTMELVKIRSSDDEWIMYILHSNGEVEEYQEKVFTRTVRWV